MNKEFDFKAAKKNLEEKTQEKIHSLEIERRKILDKTLESIKKHFKKTSIQVFLVGSILKPGQFHSSSDVDIVLKNFQGDRFELWPLLENEIGRTVELILYENCSFKDYVDQHGFKVV